MGVMGGLPTNVVLANDVGDLQCNFVGAVMQSQAHHKATKRDKDPQPMDGILPPVVSDSSSTCATSGVI